MTSTKCTKSKGKVVLIVLATITLIIPFFLMLSNDDNQLETAQTFCPLKLMTGVPCMGCGITKSMVYFYQGDLQKSMQYHLFGPFLILLCTVAIVMLLTELFTQKDFLYKLIFRKPFICALAFFLVFYYFFKVVF